MIDEITNILTDLGFAKEDDVFSKVERRVVGRTIVNNQVHEEVQDVHIQIEYLGDGWIGNSESDNHPTEGFKLKVNNYDMGDVWVSCAEDFKQSFGIR